MSELDLWPRLVVATLATWRIAHLLAREDGPGDVLARARARLGAGFFGRLMDCFHCLSLWVAAPVAFTVGRRPLDWLLAWLALSGAACLLERLGQPPVIIEPIPRITESPARAEALEGGGDDGMLRPDASRAPEHASSGVAGARPSPVT